MGCVNVTMNPEGLAVKKIEKIPPPQKVWGWQVALYLFLAGMGAGAYTVGVILGWTWNLFVPIEIFNVTFDVAKGVLYWGPLLAAIGAPFLILDLGIKERFLYACLNPRTSWVARGFLILSTFIILGLSVFGTSLLFPGVDLRSSPFWTLLEVITLLLAVSTALYTGILLKSVRYVPIWNTLWLPVLFLASALSTGSMAIVLAMIACGLTFPEAQGLLVRAHQVASLERIFILMEGVILAFYLYTTYQKKEEGEVSVRLLFAGKLRWLFWGGVVFLGFLFPVVLELLSTWQPDQLILLLVTGISLLLGGFFLRWAILASGVKEKHLLHKFLELRANLGPSIPKGRGDRTG